MIRRLRESLMDFWKVKRDTNIALDTAMMVILRQL